MKTLILRAMIKYSIVLINFIGVLFAGLFSEDGVTVDHKIPSVIHPGEKIAVPVEINKAQIAGFAKLEVSVPSGFIASAGDTKGASFTFSKQQAKFIWFELPAEEVFTVTYYLEPTAGTLGKFNVGGTFSWVKTNQRVDYSIPAKSIEVVEGEAVASTPVDTPVSTVAEPLPSLPAVAEPITTSADNVVPVVSDYQLGQNEVVCSRNVTMLSETEALVNLNIQIDGIKGFVKVFEVAPTGCTALRETDGGAVVTPDKNTIKFFWFEVPQTPQIALSYKIRCGSPMSGTPNIIGKVSYIHDNEPIERDVINAGSTPLPPVVVSPVKPNPDNGNTAANNPPANNNSSAGPKTTPKTSVTSVPDPENGVTYKVQILAGHKVVNKSYFNSRHNYNENFGIENHEGWVKYTTGKFNEYKGARDERERLRNSYGTLPGPFVTAYNNGERITVQEALLISKQQWTP